MSYQPLQSEDPTLKPVAMSTTSELTDDEIDAITDAQWGAGCQPNQYKAHRAYARAILAAWNRRTEAPGSVMVPLEPRVGCCRLPRHDRCAA